MHLDPRLHQALSQHLLVKHPNQKGALPFCGSTPFGLILLNPTNPCRL